VKLDKVVKSRDLDIRLDKTKISAKIKGASPTVLIEVRRLCILE